MRRPLVAATVLATVVAACTPSGFGRGVASVPELSPPAGYRLYVASRDDLVAVDSATGKTETRLPASLLAPDGKSAFGLTDDGRTLAILDPLTGATTRRLSLPAAFQFPPATLMGLPSGLSRDGHWLTLVSFEPPLRDGPTRRSTFLVVDTSFAAPARIVPLDGRFEYGGLSEDGRYLFLNEWLRRVQHSHGFIGAYQARLYDLEQRSWSPSPAAGTPDESEVVGTRLAGLASPGGAWQYTLFMAGDEPAFIHAQSLRDRTAWRINLPTRPPAEENAADDFVWAMDVTRDGRQLYAVNASLGQIVAVETPVAAGARPRIIQQGRMQSAKAARSPFWMDAHAKRFVFGGAVLSPDASVLYAVGDWGVLAVNTADLSVRGRWATRLQFLSLALTPDGSWLFGLNGRGLVAIDTRSGAAAPAIPADVNDALAIVGVLTR